MDKRALIFMFVMTTAFLLLNNFLFDRNVKPGNAEVHEEIKKVSYVTEPIKPNNEEFYVLENDYQQVVFSNLSGAIAEINLTVSSEEKSKGAIEAIALDKEIAEKTPQNALFPNFSYHVVNEQGEPTTQQPSFGGYTPLLRRTLKNSDETLLFQMPPTRYATALIGEDQQDPTTYKVTNFTRNSIEFIGKEADRTVRKTYRLLDQAPYSVELEVQVTGDPSGLWLTSGIMEADLINGSYIPVMQYQTQNGKKLKMKKISLPSTSSSYDSLRPVWSGISSGFFGLIIDPLSSKTMGLRTEKLDGSSIMSRLTAINPEFESYPASKFPGYEWLTPFKMTNQPMKYLLYAGPFDKKSLTHIDNILAQEGNHHALADAMGYSSWTSAIAGPFAGLLSIFLNALYTITRSWGLSIILLTLLLRVAIFPLNQWSLKSQKRMQEVAPKQKALQEKYKGDPKRMHMEIAMLYRNERVNPFLGGCLPMLLQLPFLFGMYQLLQTNYALRGASFIPGWIDNLAAPDTLFSWGSPIIFFGTSFHLLPFILGGLTYIQGKMNAWMQKEKVQLTDQQKQMNSIATIMPFAMTFIFYSMPSGLNLYWIFSSLFGIVQQWIVMRQSQKPQKVKKVK